MTTKVTDKGIIYPDGTKQNTAAYGAGGGSIDAYTKAETDNKFYDKDEIDSLIEDSSGAIVANYTNKWASSVARNPEAGNLYLVYGMNFSSKYNEVTKIYISDTDGDGKVRDFDQVEVDDKISLTSENGSGEYTIVTVSDVGGYRELVVSTESSNGTISNDTPILVVMNVEASSGAEAVAFSAFSDDVNTNDGLSSVAKTILFNNVSLDTDNGFNADGSTYTIQKDGTYNLSATISFKLNKVPVETRIITAKLYINDDIYASGFANAVKVDNFVYDSVPLDVVKEFKKGDRVQIKWYTGITQEVSVYCLEGSTTFSGHMVSSITEGEVKEKEAVVVRAYASADQSVGKGTSKVIIDTVEYDTNSNYDVSTSRFKPTVAGYYQVSGTVIYSGTDLTASQAFIWKNSYPELSGSYQESVAQSVVLSSVEGIVYLDPDHVLDDGTVGDYLELYGYTGSETSSLYARDYHNSSSFSASLITGQSSGGGSGGGEVKEPVVFKAMPTAVLNPITKGTWEVLKFNNVIHNTNGDWTDNKYTPKVAGYYNFNYSFSIANTGDTLDGRLAITLRKNGENTQRYGLDNIVKSYEGDTVEGSTLLYMNGIDDYVEVEGNTTHGLNYNGGQNSTTFFDASLITGSGGGSYTPEDMVWSEDLGDRDGGTKERELGGTYTNTNDVPIYVQFRSWIRGDGEALAIKFYINDKYMGSTGTQMPSGLDFNNPLYIVPAKATYRTEIVGDGDPSLFYLGVWREARMPVAVGTGGSIWTEEGGVATYDGDIKVNDVTVGSKTKLNTTVVGRNALGKITSGTHNTAVGYSSLRDTTEGTHNTALGMQALSKNETGDFNIAVGHNALLESTLDKNTAIGYRAGDTLTTGINNTLVGHNAQPSAPDVSNEVTIGNDAITKTRLMGDVQLEEKKFLTNLYDKAVEGLGAGLSDENIDRTYTIQLPNLYGTWEVVINATMHKKTGGKYGTRNIVLHCGGLSGYPYTTWAMAHNEVSNMARTQTGPAPTITLVMEKENKIKVTLSGTGGKKSSWSARLMSPYPSY